MKNTHQKFNEIGLILRLHLLIILILLVVIAFGGGQSVSDETHKSNIEDRLKSERIQKYIDLKYGQ